MGGRAREGNRREPTGQTGEAAPPARGPAGEQQSAETQPSVVETWQARVFRRNPNPTNPPIPNSWPRRRSPGPEAFPSSEVPAGSTGAPHFRPGLSPARPRVSCVQGTAPRVPKGSAAVGAPKPRVTGTFPTRRGDTPSPTQTGIERPGLGAPLRRHAEAAPPRHLRARFSPNDPRRTPAPPAPAPWRPKPRGAVGAGRSRRAGAHPRPARFARASARTARAEHVAPGRRVRP